MAELILKIIFIYIPAGVFYIGLILFFIARGAAKDIGNG